MAYSGDKKREYQLKWMKERRAKYLGGKCCYFCGTKDQIEIHHVDPSEKEHHNIWSWSDERIKAELIKCIYICKGCHSKFHAIMKTMPLVHGTPTGYEKYKCRCPLCRAWKAWESHKSRHNARIAVNGWDWFVKNFHDRYGISETDISRITGKAA